MHQVYIWLLAVLLSGCFSKKPPEMQIDVERLHQYLKLDGLQPVAAKWAWYARGHQRSSGTEGLGPSDYAFIAVLTLPAGNVQHLQESVQKLDEPAHLDPWDAREWLPSSVTKAFIRQNNGYYVNNVYSIDGFTRNDRNQGFFFVSASNEICIVLYETP